jgi:hypothetical protein
MCEIILNSEHENLYNLMKEQKINHCDEKNCQANDGQGSCRINTCALIDPQKAIIELKKIKEGNMK